MIEESDLQPITSETIEQGLLIVFSGPSGVGKGSILANATTRLPNLHRSISVTTRPARKGEQDGVDYFFRTPQEFEQLKQEQAFLEWAQYLDHSYGTPRAWVLEQLRAGRDVTLEIDVQGGKQVRESFPQAVLIFVEPPSEEALRARLIGRNTETKEVLDKRVKAYLGEREALRIYDYIITNDRLDEAVDLFCCIIRAEHARVARRLDHE